MANRELILPDSVIETNLAAKSSTSKILIVASSFRAPNAESEIEAGLRPRTEYVELAKVLGADVFDYRQVNLSKFGNFADSFTILKPFFAHKLKDKVERNGYKNILFMSEGLAITMAIPGLDIRKDIIRSVYVHHPLSARQRNLENLLNFSKKWDRAIFFSQAEANFWIERYSQLDMQVGVLHTNVDTCFFDKKQVPDPDKKAFDVLSVGVAGRDYNTIFKTAEKLPEVSFAIDGSSAWEKAVPFENAIIPPNVKLIHAKSLKELREFYAKAKMLVIPLLKNNTLIRAGSNSYTEGMAMGLPIILSYNPGSEEYVKDGYNGFLVEPGNPDYLADSIVTVLQNESWAAQMGTNSRLWAENNCLDSWVSQMKSMILGC